MRATWRGARILLHMLLGIVLSALYRITFGQKWFATPAGRQIIRWWMLMVTRLIGIRIAQYGQANRQPTLFVANHISFLDIIVVSGLAPVQFLSKSTVRYWPLIGYLSTITGTLYIKRGKTSLIARTIQQVAQVLEQGSVVVFPEGTTGLGKELKKFHSGLFQSAIDSQTPIQPVALRYMRNGDVDRISAYIENDNFMLNLWQVLKQPHTDVHVCFCPPNQANQERQALAKQSQQQIQTQLDQQNFIAVH